MDSESPKPSRRVVAVAEAFHRPRSPQRGIFIRRQLASLARIEGWDVRVCVPRPWYPRFAHAWKLARSWRAAEAQARDTPDRWNAVGVEAEALVYQNRAPARFSRPRSSIGRIANALIDRLRARPADLLMAEFALPLGPAVRLAARATGMPYVVRFFGDDVMRDPFISDRKRADLIETVGDAALVLSVCRAMIDQFTNIAGSPPPCPAAVLPRGIDLGMFRPADPEEYRRARATLGLGDDERAIACVGTAEPRKGWLDLLDALGSLGPDFGPIALLTATGAGRSHYDLVAEAARRAPNVRMITLGDTPPERLAEVLRAADAFALLSLWEGMCNAVLEAMASGLPVVATGVVGHPEAIDDGVEGYLVPPRDPGRAAEALRAVFADPDRRRAMGQAGRRRALAIGDLDANGRRLGELLEATLRRRFDPAWSARNPYAAPAEVDVRVG